MITNKSELNNNIPTLYITLDPLSIGTFLSYKSPPHRHTHTNTCKFEEQLEDIGKLKAFVVLFSHNCDCTVLIFLFFVLI